MPRGNSVELDGIREGISDGRWMANSAYDSNPNFSPRTSSDSPCSVSSIYSKVDSRSGSPRSTTARYNVPFPVTPTKTSLGYQQSNIVSPPPSATGNNNNFTRTPSFKSAQNSALVYSKGMPSVSSSLSRSPGERGNASGNWSGMEDESFANSSNNNILYKPPLHRKRLHGVSKKRKVYPLGPLNPSVDFVPEQQSILPCDPAGSMSNENHFDTSIHEFIGVGLQTHTSSKCIVGRSPLEEVSGNSKPQSQNHPMAHLGGGSASYYTTCGTEDDDNLLVSMNAAEATVVKPSDFSYGGVHVQIEANDKRRLSFSSNLFSTLGACCTPDGGFTHDRILVIVSICCLIVVLLALAECAANLYLHLAVEDTSRRPSIILDVIGCLTTVIGCCTISAFAFSAIRSAKVATVLTAMVASHISRYDLDGAEKHLEAMEASTPTMLGREFRSILYNLRMYQRFLPRSLVQMHKKKSPNSWEGSNNSVLDIQRETESFEDGCSEQSHYHDDNTSTSHSQQNNGGMLFATHRLRSYKFKQVRGTIMIVRLINLSTSSPQRATETVNYFLSESMATVEDFGGVVDQIEANSLIITFNYHIPLIKHEDAACKCAAELLQRLTSSVFSPRIVVAICSGANLVGTVGSDTHKSRVVTGESMDLCKKLHSLQSFDSIILATESVIDRTTLAAVPMDVLAPNWFQTGRCKSFVVYEIQGGLKKREAPAELKRIAEGFQMLRMRRAVEAYDILKDIPHPQARRLSHMAKRLQLDSSLGSGGGSNLYQRKELGWEMIEDDDFFASGNIDEMFSSRNMSFREDNAIDAARRKLMKMHVAGQKKVQMEMHPSKEEDSLFSIFIPVADSSNGTNVAYNKDEVNDLSATESMIGSPHCDGQVVPFNHTELAEEKDDELPMILTDSAGINYHRSKSMLGKGAFGKVYLAMDDDGTLCALKAFPLSGQTNETNYGEDPLVAARAKAYTLIHEVEVLAEMRHENIAAYVSCAVGEKFFCIMMEYLSAGSLRTMISPENYGSIPTKVILSYMRDILNGLQFLHDNNYVHCDIKPDNILLTGDGSCKLADFGTAKLLQLEHDTTGISFKGHAEMSKSLAALSKYHTGLDGDESVINTDESTPPLIRVPSENSAMNSSTTFHVFTADEILKVDSAMVRGTPRYMAPEAALGEFEPASDIYSIGISILELATGVNPWFHIKGDDTTFLMRLATDDGMRPTVPDDLHPDLLKLVRKSIHQDPTQRASVGELLMILHE